MSVLLISFFFLGPKISSAASFSFVLDKANPIVGDVLIADLKIDSEDVSINAGQSTIKYPSNILKVESIDKTDSIFNFWLDEPNFDNVLGELSFIGGSTISGYSGKSLQIIRIKFKVIGNGEASLIFSDTAISAADGTGANVLSVSKGVTFTVSSKSEIEKVKTEQITREAELAKKLPAKPVLNVALYPNPENWYNLSSDFGVSWNLPKDVTDVAAVLNKIPITEPVKSEGLFDNKNFKALENGVWYLHVRFKNNIGWGVTNNYRIAIDSEPPLAFEVIVLGGLSSDNPVPTIVYESKDQFSGIGGYFIKIDNEAEIKTEKTEFTFPNLMPAKHKVTVTAKDKAGNATSSNIEIEVLPIASPQILFVSRELFIGEGGLAVNGSSVQDAIINVYLKTESGQTILETKTNSTDKGFWSLSIDQPLKKGNYYVEIKAQDSRGAWSLPVKSENINLSERPVITIGGIDLTYKWFVITLIVILLISFVLGYWTRLLSRISRQRRILIAERDVNAQLQNIKKDVSGLIEKHKNIEACTPKSIENEVNFVLKKIETNIQKNSDYILENIEEI